MSRLGFNKFYAQGGDWGSAIVAQLSGLYPDRYVVPLTMFSNSARFDIEKSKNKNIT